HSARSLIPRLIVPHTATAKLVVCALRFQLLCRSKWRCYQVSPSVPQSLEEGGRAHQANVSATFVDALSPPRSRKTPGSNSFTALLGVLIDRSHRHRRHPNEPAAEHA